MKTPVLCLVLLVSISLAKTVPSSEPSPPLPKLVENKTTKEELPRTISTPVRSDVIALENVEESQEVDRKKKSAVFCIEVRPGPNEPASKNCDPTPPPVVTPDPPPPGQQEKETQIIREEYHYHQPCPPAPVPSVYVLPQPPIVFAGSDPDQEVDANIPSCPPVYVSPPEKIDNPNPCPPCSCPSCSYPTMVSGNALNSYAMGFVRSAEAPENVAPGSRTSSGMEIQNPEDSTDLLPSMPVDAMENPGHPMLIAPQEDHPAARHRHQQFYTQPINGYSYNSPGYPGIPQQSSQHHRCKSLRNPPYLIQSAQFRDASENSNLDYGSDNNQQALMGMNPDFRAPQERTRNKYFYPMIQPSGGSNGPQMPQQYSHVRRPFGCTSLQPSSYSTGGQTYHGKLNIPMHLHIAPPGQNVYYRRDGQQQPQQPQQQPQQPQQQPQQPHQPQQQPHQPQQQPHQPQQQPQQPPQPPQPQQPQQPPQQQQPQQVQSWSKQELQKNQQSSERSPSRLLNQMRGSSSSAFNSGSSSFQRASPIMQSFGREDPKSGCKESGTVQLRVPSTGQSFTINTDRKLMKREETSTKDAENAVTEEKSD